ncbi:6867_t:CDS:2 [Ambispora leptoticha]|uniref:6867_t:CDS:1 n=1 Tax=Ambispora leptoticha TaxID=144679 RepID=A0A9N9DMW2_9GLOM|nr:6867_t:CDS:2 [Ambispora leptoticha]
MEPTSQNETESTKTTGEIVSSKEEVETNQEVTEEQTREEIETVSNILSSDIDKDKSKNALMLEAAKKEKDKGNEYFKAGNIVEALRHYHQALLNINGIQNNKSHAIFRHEQNKEAEKDELQEEIIKTQALIHSNLAACHIKGNKPSRAIECANKALKLDPDNEKARFRRAQAYISEGNIDAAAADLKKLSNPDDPMVKREWQRLKIKDKEMEAKQRKDLKGMFERMKKQDEKEEAEKKKKDAELQSNTSLPENSANEPKIKELEPEVDEKEPKIQEIIQ